MYNVAMGISEERKMTYNIHRFNFPLTGPFVFQENKQNVAVGKLERKNKAHLVIISVQEMIVCHF